jgi:hypothetical protein
MNHRHYFPPRHQRTYTIERHTPAGWVECAHGSDREVMRRHAAACGGLHAILREGSVVEMCDFDEAADVLEVA